MRNGTRRHRVLIEKPADPEVRDPFGGVIETWEAHASRWGFVEPLEGDEFFAGQQIQTAADHRILLPYDSLTAQITASMRISHLDKVFDVQSVINTNTGNAELQVMARVRA